MKRLLKPLLYAAAVLSITEGCFFSPFKSWTTTVFGRVTDNDTKLPVDSVQIMITGEKGVVASNADELKIIYTDKQGYYSTTINVPNGYHKITVLNRYFDKLKYTLTYRGYFSYKDRNRIDYCCPAEIGSKTQYDFIMLPK
jgi:hypothetical protein